jgi:DNA replication factor GINS
MNLDELRSVQAKERRKDSLQHLRDAFYDDVAAYISDLRDARDRRAEQVENPFSDDDVRRLSDEIETAEEVAEALYERRVGKVVKLASFAAADMPVEQEGMTSQERALFEDLVERIERNKSSVLDVLSGTIKAGEASSDATADPPRVDAEPNARPESIEANPTDEASTDPVEGDSRSRPSNDEPPVPPEDPPGSAGMDGNESARPDGNESARPDGTGSAKPDDGGMLADAMAGGDASDGSDDPSGDSPAAAPSGDAVAGDGPNADGPPTGSATGSHEGMQPPDDDGTIGDPSDDAAAEEDPERTTVRIKRDVGSILGVDEREYDLESEDVVRLPSSNAEPLLARDAAERIE